MILGSKLIFQLKADWKSTKKLAWFMIWEKQLKVSWKYFWEAEKNLARIVIHQIWQNVDKKLLKKRISTWHGLWFEEKHKKWAIARFLTFFVKTAQIVNATEKRFLMHFQPNARFLTFHMISEIFQICQIDSHMSSSQKSTPKFS